MPRQSQRECKAVVRHDAMDELDDEDDENAPESSEEALEEDGGDDNDGDDDDDDEEEEEEDVNKPAVVLKKRKRNYAKARHVCTKDGLVPLSTRPNKKRKKKDYVIDEKLEALPTYTRKTTHGGYAHTNLSRSRISESNSGNTPWNYGKQRSSADKAKIAAGVRARNHTILLEKLENLGLTEEEWIKKKKEIKHLREKLRKAKLTNMKSETELHSKILQEALDATDEKKMKEIKARVKDEEKKRREDERNKIQDERTKKIFSERMIWRPNNNNISSYDEACIDAGPGGLICCEDCSSKYNAYLTSTIDDAETQRMNKGTQEVTEILDILNEKKDMLKGAADSAKMKIPPLPPPGMRIMNYAQENNKVAGVGAPRPNGSSKSESNTNKYDYDNMSSEIDINVGSLWNLTSSIDIGITGGIASI